MSPVLPRLVPIDAIVQAYSLSRSSVYELVKHKGMPSYKPGKRLLFDPDEVFAWLRAETARKISGRKRQISLRRKRD